MAFCPAPWARPPATHWVRPRRVARCLPVVRLPEATGAFGSFETFGWRWSRCESKKEGRKLKGMKKKAKNRVKREYFSDVKVNINIKDVKVRYIG